MKQVVPIAVYQNHTSEELRCQISQLHRNRLRVPTRDRLTRVRLRPGRCLRRESAGGQSTRHLHRCSRPLRPKRCRRSPARRISPRPPSSFLALLRSSASAACRSASSPVAEELQFAGHPTLGTASWLYWNHASLRGAEQITLDLRVGPIPVRFTPSTAERARRLRHHEAE